jgi:hypothetical protein
MMTYGWNLASDCYSFLRYGTKYLLVIPNFGGV